MSDDIVDVPDIDFAPDDVLYDKVCNDLERMAVVHRDVVENGVDQGCVAALESIKPNMIMDKFPSGGFTHERSTQNLTFALEEMGTAMKIMIAAATTAVAMLLVKLFTWVMKKIGFIEDKVDEVPKKIEKIAEVTKKADVAEDKVEVVVKHFGNTHLPVEVKQALIDRMTKEFPALSAAHVNASMDITGLIRAYRDEFQKVAYEKYKPLNVLLLKAIVAEEQDIAVLRDLVAELDSRSECLIEAEANLKHYAFNDFLKGTAKVTDVIPAPTFPMDAFNRARGTAIFNNIADKSPANILIAVLDNLEMYFTAPINPPMLKGQYWRDERVVLNNAIAYVDKLNAALTSVDYESIRKKSKAAVYEFKRLAYTTKDSKFDHDNMSFQDNYPDPENGFYPAHYEIKGYLNPQEDSKTDYVKIGPILAKYRWKMREEAMIITKTLAMSARVINWLSTYCSVIKELESMRYKMLEAFNDSFKIAMKKETVLGDIEEIFEDVILEQDRIEKK